MEGEDERARVVEAAGHEGERARHWWGAVKALSGEPVPPRLRMALVELGAQGHRLRVAVEAYRARVDRMMRDPEARERPIRECRDWPEHRERQEALDAYGDARRVVAEMACAWVEGRVGAGP